jgi:hypothetical protein
MESLLTTREASEFLRNLGVKRSFGTLTRQRVTGGCTPPYRKFGRTVLYHPDDLRCWVEQTLSAPRRSTSDSAAIC